MGAAKSSGGVRPPLGAAPKEPHPSADLCELRLGRGDFRFRAPPGAVLHKHARTFLRAFFAWYNTQYDHAGLALLTPHDVHHGLASERLVQRAQVLSAAYAAHPERFVRRPPKPATPPTAVYINPPKPTTATLETRA